MAAVLSETGMTIQLFIWSWQEFSVVGSVAALNLLVSGIRANLGMES
jgi:hypothetical protein